MTVGLTVTHRRYVTYADAHYGGNLVNGAYVLDLFGDVGTEASIRMDGDEGLLASYSDVQFRAPVRAGDVIEVTATVTAVGRRAELHVGIGRQQAFVAVHPDRRLGPHVAEQVEHVRPVDQVPAVVGVRVRHVPAVRHRQADLGAHAASPPFPGEARACTR